VSPTEQSTPAGKQLQDWKLQDWQIQLQLCTIEENNLDRRSFSPLPLWNQNPKMFGEPASDTRKVFSRFVSNTVKRIGIKNYVKLLKRNKIEMSSTTRAELEAAEGETKQVDVDRMDMEETDNEPTEQRDKPTEMTAILPEQTTALNSSFDYLVNGLSGMNISASCSTSSIGSPSQLFGSPGTHNYVSPGFGSPTGPERTTTSYPVANYNPDGTKRYPNVIFKQADGHRGNGNTFICQGQVELDHFEYHATIVQCSGPPDDYKHYELRIANAFEVPACFQNYIGRVLLFREPAANFTARQVEKYGIAKSNNPGGKKPVVNALKAEAVSAERDPELFFNYSIIVFPLEQEPFANRIFSPKSDFLVDSEKTGIHNKPEDNTTFKKDQYGLTLTWTIALAGKCRELKSTAVEPDADSFFMTD